MSTRRTVEFRASSSVWMIARSPNRAAVRAIEQMSASMMKTLREKSPSAPCVRTTMPSAATPETTTAATTREASRALA
jgi:hypothetical protein